VPAGIELKSRRVLRPLKRAKSTVCALVKSETGVEEPSESVMLCKLTEKETTLGRGASVPSKYTEPVCAEGVEPLLLGALPFPVLQATKHDVIAIAKNTRIPWIHFIKPPAFSMI
jgi:hypothetical protein